MRYTPSQAEAAFKKVIKDIENGASMHSALKKDGAPSQETFYKWLDKDPEKANKYARATEKRAERIFEDIINIADENHRDVYLDSEGVERTDHDVVQRAKLRIDARKWMLAKMQPKKYGDKLDVTSDNKAIALPPIVGMVIKNETQTDEPTTEHDPLD